MSRAIDNDSSSSASVIWMLLTVPALMMLCLTFAAPFFLLATNSLHLDEGLGQLSQEFTLENFTTFFSDGFYISLLMRTFTMGAVVVVVCVCLGYPVAYFLARADGFLRSAGIFCVVAPLLISVVIRSLGMFPILGESGLVNTVLFKLGLIQQPVILLNNITGVEIGLTHALLPLMILSLVVAIQSVSVDLEIAAGSLGARPWRTFFFVILPLTRAGLFAGAMMVFSLSISAYTTPVMLGGNRVLVVSTFIGKEMLSTLEYAVAATCSVVLVLSTMGLAVLAARGSGQRGVASA